MQEKEKKVWQKPELVILTRGNPEEAVLGFCKSSTNPALSGPNGVGVGTCTTGGACSVINKS